MSKLELNKFAASIFIAGIIFMVIGFVGNFLYKPVYKEHPEAANFVADASAGNDVAQEEVVINIPELMANASAERGKDIAKKCVSCHSFEQGGAHKVGPNLWAVYGAKVASKSGYAYSPALTGHGGVWNEEELYHFVNGPAKYIPGTKMTFLGIKKPDQVADLVKYLEQNK